MATTYTLDWSSVAKPAITLAPGDSDLTSSSIALFGENSFLWGEGTNENFMHMLEHFSSNVAPSNPTSGQLWWDTGSNQMQVWNGSAWASVGSGATFPQTADGATIIRYTGASTQDQTSDGTIVYDWDYVQADPYTIYGGTGAMTPTTNLLAPPGATKMKITASAIMSYGAASGPPGANFTAEPPRLTFGINDLNIPSTNFDWWLSACSMEPNIYNWSTAFLFVYPQFTTPWIPVNGGEDYAIILRAGGIPGQTIAMYGSNYAAAQQGSWVMLQYS